MAATPAGRRRSGRLAGLLLAADLAACNGSPGTPVSVRERPTTTHRDSASAFDVTVSPKTARRGSVVTVRAILPPYCLAAPHQVAVIIADEELQRAGRAGSGKRVPHRITASVVRATYTIAEGDSLGESLFIVGCGNLGGDGMGTFEIRGET